MRFSLEIFGTQPRNSGSLAAELKWEINRLLLEEVQLQRRRGSEELTVSVRVKEAKYSEAVVFPFWSDRQLLHCGSGLQR